MFLEHLLGLGAEAVPATRGQSGGVHANMGCAPFAAEFLEPGGGHGAAAGIAGADEEHLHVLRGGRHG